MRPDAKAQITLEYGENFVPKRIHTVVVSTQHSLDVENETIVLLGNPVLIDKNKGKVEGDKLTFFIADDRITVENQGQERSITVIK